MNYRLLRRTFNESIRVCSKESWNHLASLATKRRWFSETSQQLPDLDLQTTVRQRCEAELYIQRHNLSAEDTERYCFEQFGFSLCLKTSRIPGAGMGVFLSQGSFCTNSLVTLYPGMVYSVEALGSLCVGNTDDAFSPSLPAFLLHNTYLLQLQAPHQFSRSGLMLDGRPDGVSRENFQRAVRNSHGTVECSWLEGSSYHSTISLGNRINHPLNPHPPVGAEDTTPYATPLPVTPSVRFQVLTLPQDFPHELLQYIPTLNSVGLPTAPRVAVAVIATEDVNDSDGSSELYVDYGRDPLTLGLQSI